MSSVFDPPPRSVGDLLHRLGDIPANRIRWTPTPGTASESDAGAAGNDFCELVDGTLVEKAMGEEESFFAGGLAIDIGMFLRLANVGYMTLPDNRVRLKPGQVRGPDVAVFLWAAQPGRRRPVEPIPAHAPDLAVEVLSRGNTRREMARKRREYFAAGTALVWEFHPRKRWVRVYTDPKTYTELSAADTLTGDPVLPGFTLRLADLFAELDRHG